MKNHREQYRTRGLAALGALMLLGSATLAQTKSQSTDAQINSYLQPFVQTGNFVGAVLVEKNGAIVLRRAYGMADIERKIPNAPKTRFHIASVSKPFTAAAVLQLQEQGKLSVSNPVSRFVPSFPNADKITIDQLLTHTSGIPNINDLPDFDAFAEKQHTPEQLVAHFGGLPLEFAPGTDYHYSNSNYNLLALILEKVAGEDYGTYIHKHILVPARMRNSGHDAGGSTSIARVAEGYQPAGVAGFEKAQAFDWSNKTGNGSLYSTLDDLYRFVIAVERGAILKAGTRSKYFVEGRGNRYGWFQRKRFGKRVMSSNGRSPGFTAVLDRFPDDDVTVIILSNSYATASHDPIPQAIEAIVFGQQPPEPPPMRAIPLAQSKLQPYAGEYQYGPDYFIPNATFTVTAGEGCLLLQLTKFPKLRTPLVPISENDFVERNFFGHVSFTQDGLVYKLDRKEYRAKRRLF